jgi:hypothetical protein
LEEEEVLDYHHAYLDHYKPTPVGVTEVLPAACNLLVVIQLQVTVKVALQVSKAGGQLVADLAATAE